MGWQPFLCHVSRHFLCSNGSITRLAVGKKGIMINKEFSDSFDHLMLRENFELSQWVRSQHVMCLISSSFSIFLFTHSIIALTLFTCNLRLLSSYVVKWENLQFFVFIIILINYLLITVLIKSKYCDKEHGVEIQILLVFLQK